ncbi:hypothetical protein BaRGS_00012406 [Batillaria attramentaria]|uniref:Uncharacterized protein n=1 Tax=Batillaria attramentaria TaxID=370345 RepID=A0ABD0L9J9_9CAEN
MLIGDPDSLYPVAELVKNDDTVRCTLGNTHAILKLALTYNQSHVSRPRCTDYAELISRVKSTVYNARFPVPVQMHHWHANSYADCATDPGSVLN